MSSRNFDEFFQKATESPPFPFQREFAQAPSLHQLIHVPTGLGKTAMAVIGWLWRRFGATEELKAATPRRLVYCLPMRVLVEQTAGNARKWIGKLRAAKFLEGDGPNVHVLMGGENEEEWDIHPEREAILVGTQDMLLSRALNRGYAASRSRWPIQFGLLHTDCLWIFDEIQLMGAGLATTAQLEAFRRLLPRQDAEQARNGHGCRSVWMSATMHRDWLRTVDFAPWVDGLSPLGLTDEDHAHEEVKQRWKAKKHLEKAAASMGAAANIAAQIRKTHRPGTRTIAVVNTVQRARELYEAIEKQWGSREGPRRVLLHSRFRPADRKKQVEEALAEIKPGEPGTIVVSTQVIEAGVDVSAATLFTELAPWGSLVQRFGRCNRRGKDNEAQVFWIDLPDKKADAEKLAPPYNPNDLEASGNRLKNLTNAALNSLPTVELAFEHIHVIRRKDLIDLFDTTPDLAGNDMDIDRFVREVEGSDVRVFWRDYGETPNETDAKKAAAAPRSEELCPAPISKFREFSKRHRGDIWRWNFLEKKWERADPNMIAPGQVFLVHVNAGGYSEKWGWDPDIKDRVLQIDPAGTKNELPDATEDERLSRGDWQTIAEHADSICRELNRILPGLPISCNEAKAIRYAARWHDRGKAHRVFQEALPDALPDATKVWAKASGAWRRYSRRHFRHELASALAVLLSDGLLPAAQCDLIGYLVAAHHGKVRLSIRSLPNESHPDGIRLFARGIWDRDVLPETDLGAGVIAPGVTLSLEPMEIGLCEEPPFADQPSWAERMLRLRDVLGPFRLACLEAILRAADMRASMKGEP